MYERQTIPARLRRARFRYEVVASLLARPPSAPGELRRRLGELAAHAWLDPVTGATVRLGRSTIERWYYRCRRSAEPLAVLRTRVRRDRGRFAAVPEVARSRLLAQYGEYGHWTVQLHAESLARWWTTQPELAGVSAPSVRTVQRFFRHHGLCRTPVPGSDSAEARRTRARVARLETRPYEVSHAHALWHVDFHHARRPVLEEEGGRPIHPVLLAYVDDHTRWVSHAQWYPSENAQAVVHGFVQAVQRTALPRRLLSDNGKPFVAAEVVEGLGRLGVQAETTLCYAPQQNGKVEVLWGQLESRLMAQLVHQSDLTLYRLNQLTQAWLHQDYHRRLHGGLAETPATRMAEAPQAGRPAPNVERLETAFTRRLVRTQRRSDGTVMVGRQRFEVPSRYRHLRTVAIRLAAWRPTVAWLADTETDAILCPLPVCDPSANAAGHRRPMEPLAVAGGVSVVPPVDAAPPSGLPPVLADWASAMEAGDFPPSFVPLDNRPSPEDR